MSSRRIHAVGPNCAALLAERRSPDACLACDRRAHRYASGRYALTCGDRECIALVQRARELDGHARRSPNGNRGRWPLKVAAVVLGALVQAGCAGLGTRRDGCDAPVPLREFPGWVVYSCPHPFLAPVAREDFRLSWVPAVTSCPERAVFLQWGHEEEIAHELGHVRACAAGGRWEHW